MHNANGTAVITVTVNDGQARNNTVIRTFTVTVVADSATNLLIKPLTNLVAMVGKTNTFTATATKTGLFYKWKFNGTNLISENGPTLTLSKITTNQAGIYSVTATDGHVTTTGSHINRLCHGGGQTGASHPCHGPVRFGGGGCDGV